jgi:hypothetical protein
MVAERYRHTFSLMKMYRIPGMAILEGPLLYRTAPHMYDIQTLHPERRSSTREPSRTELSMAGGAENYLL